MQKPETESGFRGLAFQERMIEVKKTIKRDIDFAIGYAIAALVIGVLYRELGKYGLLQMPETVGRIHGHLLSLGTLFLLLLAALDQLFDFGKEKGADSAFWIYQAGLVLSALMMFVRGWVGILNGPINAALSGIAGIGHLLLAVGLVWMLFVLRKAVIRR